MIDATGLEVRSKSFQLANKAIDVALSSLAAADPLVPFAMTWNSEEPVIERFMYDAYDDSIEMAMRSVCHHGEGASGYAVVWNGYVEIDGRKRDAVIAEVGDRHSRHSLQVAQPYAEDRDGTMVAAGEMLAIGESDNLLQMQLNNETLSRHLLRPAYLSTHGMMQAVTEQAFAQMPIALICLAANIFEGREAERVMLGIRKLQAVEAERSVAISHHVFGVLAAEVAYGDLMSVLPTDDLQELTAIVIAGGRQITEAVQHQQLSAHDAQSYLATVRAILEATLFDDSAAPAGESGQRLLRLLDKVAPLH